jgi:hypothetical protein
MYVLESKNLAKMTVFAGLLWFRGYPNLCETFLAEDGECFPQGSAERSYLLASPIEKQ